MKSMPPTNILVLLLAAAMLAGCASHSPRYGGSGVYHEQPHHQPVTRVHTSPVHYPYWSLDYFYFSRHYHPYSVVVHRQDPWFYPYPGWYYGYRPGPRTRVGLGFGHYYPWYAAGPYYHGYRPWQSSLHFSYWRYDSPRRGGHRPAYGHHEHPVTRENVRLREMQRRQVQSARTPGHRGGVPMAGPRIPSSSRQSIPRQSPRTGTSRFMQRTHPAPASTTPRQRRDGGVRSRSDITIRARAGTPSWRDGSTGLNPRELQRSAPGRAPARSQPSSRPDRGESSSPPTRTRSSGPTRNRSSGPTRSRSSAPRRSSSGPTRSSRGGQRSRNRER